MPRDPFPFAVEIAEAIDLIPEADLQTAMEEARRYDRTCQPTYPPCIFATVEDGIDELSRALDEHVASIAPYAAARASYRAELRRWQERQETTA
jgi:hypothetical protein